MKPDEMVCESGRGVRHVMPAADGVYVFTRRMGQPESGELVACPPCAHELEQEALAKGASVARTKGPLAGLAILDIRYPKGGAPPSKPPGK